MIDFDAVPEWPVLAIQMLADGSVEVDGRTVPVVPGEDARTTAMNFAMVTARRLGRPLRVAAREADGTLFPLIVGASGEIVEAGAPVPPAAERRGLLRRRRPKVPRDVPVPPAPGSEPPGRHHHLLGAESPAPSDASARPWIVRSIPHTPEVVTDAEVPQPGEHRAEALRRVRDLAAEGDHIGALLVLGELQPDAVAGESAALREVRAYLTFLSGDVAAAARLYVSTALDWHQIRGEPDAWALGLTECAHYCWLQLEEQELVYDLGFDLVKAYAKLGVAEEPRASSVGLRLAGLRQQLE